MAWVVKRGFCSPWEMKGKASDTGIMVKNLSLCSESFLNYRQVSVVGTSTIREVKEGLEKQRLQARSALVEHPRSVPSTHMVVQEISCSSDLQQACMWCTYTHTGKTFIHRKWNQSWEKRNKGRRNQTCEKAYTIHRWVLIFVFWEVKPIIIIF